MTIKHSQMSIRPSLRPSKGRIFIWTTVYVSLAEVLCIMG